MAPFAHYGNSTMRAQNSAVPHQESILRFMAGICRLHDCHWSSKWRSSYGKVFHGQLPKLRGNVEGVVLITISITVAVPVNNKAVFTLPILPDARTGTGRERYASSCLCTHCFHCVGFVWYTQATSGGVRCGRERYASGWCCSVNAGVDASGSGSDAPSISFHANMF